MKSFKNWKMPAATVLPLVMLTTPAWAGSLRSPDRGLDQATLVEDSKYMRGMLKQKAQGTPEDQLVIDMADPRQYRFVMNRLRGSGKTPENSPQLFERLRVAREKALSGQAGARKQEGGSMTLTTQGWGCDHFLHLGAGTASSGIRTYEGNPWAACLNGASYVYSDVVAYNSDLPETQSTVVDSAAGEEYGYGQSFDDVAVHPQMPVGADRKLILDSLMIAMKEETGEELLTFVQSQTTTNTVVASIDLTHPRYSVTGSTKGNIETCQLRGGSDCDYAVVGSNMQPFPSNPTALALRNTSITSSWVGDASQSFAFSAPFDWRHIYIPTQFTFNAGSRNGTTCVIKEVLAGSKARLVKPVTGGTCMSQSDLSAALAGAINSQTANFRNLVDLSRETSIAGTGTENCTSELILNQAVEYVLTVSTKINCGGSANIPATVTVRTMSDPRYRYGLKVWNSCMAEGTKVARADGTLIPVEQVKKGDKVVTNDKGLALTVTDVSHGGEPKPMVNLRDNLGHEVSLTEQHPVLMASGEAVPAVKLKVSDRVQTQQGLASIVSIERAPYTGKVYNLTLGTKEELAKVGQMERTMFANGFMVGDNSMQAELSTPKADTRDVLARLPQPWHKDYQKSAGFVAGQR